MNDKINVSIVYCILNIETNNRYVGSTTRMSNRKRQHLHDLRKNKHVSKLMQEEFNQYGEVSFHFLQLEEVLTFSRDELFEREQYWIDKYQPAYNTIAVVKKYFPDFTPEARERSRQAKIGRKQSQEEKDKRAQSIREFWARPENKGKKVVSQKQKDHLSKINTGKRNPNWGLKRTPEQLKNMSDGRANILYIFKSPEGKEVSFRNLLTKGEEITGITYGSLRRLVRGLVEEYKGWRFVGKA